MTPPRPERRWRAALAGLAAGCCAAASAAQERSADDAAIDAMLSGLPPAPAAPAADAPAASQDGVRGLVQPRVRAMLSSAIAAKVTQIGPDPGERFEEGDVLAAFDCSFFQAQRRQAAAQLKAARQTRDVQKRINELGSGSVLELSLAEADAIKASAEVSIIDAKLKDCVIAAPFSGVVAARVVNAHESVAPGDDLIEILDDASLEAVILYPSAALKDVAIGAPFTMTFDETGESVVGAISRIGAQIDAASRTIELFGSLESAERGLIAGMSGRVAFAPPP